MQVARFLVPRALAFSKKYTANLTNINNDWAYLDITEGHPLDVEKYLKENPMTGWPWIWVDEGWILVWAEV